jgi:ribosome-binding factor A
MRRQLGGRLQLRRVPELEFVFDRSVAHQARVEQLLQEIHAQDASVSDDARDNGSDDHHEQ